MTKYNLIFQLLFIPFLIYSQNDNEFIWENAIDLYLQGDYTNSINEINQIDSLSLTCEMIELKLECYHHLRKYDVCIDYIEKAKEICSLNSVTFTNLGDSYFKQNQVDSAIVNFYIANKIDPENPIVNWNLGLCNYLLSDLNKAKFYLKESIRNQNPDLDPYDLLMQIYNETNCSDSTFLLLKSLENHEDVARVTLMKAYAYGNQHKYRKSLKIIDKVLAMNTTDYATRYNCYLNKYLAYTHMKKESKACEIYKMMLSLYLTAEIPKYFECEE